MDDMKIMTHDMISLIFTVDGSEVPFPTTGWMYKI